MRVLVVLIQRGPEERPNHTRALNGAEGEVHPPHHDLVLLMSEGDDIGRKCLILFSVLLQARNRGEGGFRQLGSWRMAEGESPYTRRSPLISFTPSPSLGGSKAPLTTPR